jgi:hypothetical protein
VHPGGGIPLAINSAKIVARCVQEDYPSLWYKALHRLGDELKSISLWALKLHFPPLQLFLLLFCADKK